ncbi:DUF559 domain-containing protein [Gordonia sp. HNM0687]|uniref:DUF559 domain-containing protein n=1 Tax=Gordonia mangrovi TaxID=2665643 RepID=A0A6L7GMV6_9ACTN|nr:DUF559 domain-containing protein [Gordonia mangrovi]MXP20521.1 DUF559 domain-containing protein [Gordonia mangrovi]UVF78886.1 DUF559 domain-containing protein [Gordonia mangrovi]
MIPAPPPPPPASAEWHTGTRGHSDWIARARRPGRVLRLTDVRRDDVDVLVAEIGDELPIIMTYCGSTPPSARGVVEDILDALERIVLSLAPAWLDTDVTAMPALDVAVAESRARDLCHANADYRPFVVELARAAASRSAPRSTPAPAHRARGLIRLLRRAYGRDDVVLAVTAPPDLDAAAQSAVAAGVGWVAEHGNVTVWIPADTLPEVTRCAPVRRHGPSVSTTSTHAAAGSAPSPTITIRRREGMPAPHSAAEQTLERALSGCPWAARRRWNRRVDDVDPLLPMAIVDLHWQAERLVVEVDGADHREPAKYAADRARDNALQRHGCLVLRYTNEQVIADVGRVVGEIHDALVERGGPTSPHPSTFGRNH